MNAKHAAHRAGRTFAEHLRDASVRKFGLGAEIKLLSASRYLAVARSTAFLFSTCALAACSSFNPYQKSPKLQQDLSPLGTSSEQVALSPNEIRVATGSVDHRLRELQEAQWAVNAQREEWFDALSAQSRVRVGSSLGLIGLSTASLISGFGASGDAVKRRLAMAGAAGAATYAGTDWWVNPAHERAYIKGYRLLTCQLGLSVALQSEVATMGLLESADGGGGQLGQLNDALNELDRVLLPIKYARLQREAMLGGESKSTEGKSPSTKGRAKTPEEDGEYAGFLGRSTLENARLLLAQLQQAGPQLRRRGELIVASIAQTIQATQKQTPEPDQLVGSSLKKVMKAFTEIEGKKDANENTDQAKGGETPSDKASVQRSKNSELLAFKLPLSSSNSTVAPPIKDEIEAQALAKAVAAVYAARRPLAHRLYNFAQARDGWLKLPECSGQDSSLSLTPDGPIDIAPGSSQEVQVWNPAGSPRFRVSSSSVEAELIQRANGGQWVRVTVGKDAKGEFTLTVSDDKGGEDSVGFKITAPVKEGGKS